MTSHDAFFYSALKELERFLHRPHNPQRKQIPAKIRRAFRTLELSYTDDVRKIKQKYRMMIRRYHPDRYAENQRKQHIATELTSHLSEAYRSLMQHVQKHLPPSD